MKTNSRASFPHQSVQLFIALAALLLAVMQTSAATTVTTLGGGNPNISPKYLGYRDGNTLTNALFHTPSGLALDSTGRYLFVADRDNNAIRYLDLQLNWTWTLDLVDTNKLSKPIAVHLDNNYFLYVLNYGSGTNGTVLTYDVDLFSPTYGYVVLTNAMKLTNAAGMAFDPSGNIYVTVQSNRLIEITAGTSTVTTVAVVTNAGAQLQGIAVKQNGFIAACDSGRNGIYLINPNNGVITTNAGFHGRGDFNINGNNVSAANAAKFNNPTMVLETGDGTLIVADTGNNRVKAVLNGGVVTNLFGVSSNFWSTAFPGWVDGAVQIPDGISAANAQSRLPYGLVEAQDGTIYVSEDYYHLIRKATGGGLAPPPTPPPSSPETLFISTNAYEQVILTWSAVSGATNYFVERSPSSGGPYTLLTSTGSTTYTDTSVVPGTTYYYVVAAVNTGGSGPFSPEATITLPYLPVPTPVIGYVTFPPVNSSSTLDFTSVFNPVSSSVTFNNDVPIVIEGASGSQTFYTYSNTATLTAVPNPTSSSGSAPAGYVDGLYSVAGLTIAGAQPYLSIKAIGEQANHPNSAIASAQFQFVVGNPQIAGANAASFTVSDITTNATLYYTLDGSIPSPTNPNAVSLAPLSGSNTAWNISFSVATNTLFQIVGYRSNYQPSSIVSNLFTTVAFQPTTMTFGFTSGQASSAFIASPGQTFYSPVTLNLVGSPTIYSLQFNITVTNGGSNPGPIPVGGYNYGFESLLEKPVPGITPVVYEYIPPAMFAGGQSVPNQVTLPDGSTGFSSLLITNNSLNLLGVGWAETAGYTNLYDTTKQTLITYSQAHDTIFNSSGGQVIVGGYAFVVPNTATNGQTYQIQIGRPSATSDGIGQPGSSVYISAPTNNGTSAGTLNALKQVTIGQFKYIAGSVYPFSWFNAGDFGSSNIVNADVEQVFEAAIYGQNSPLIQAPGSDFFDAMDSSGSLGTLDSNSGDPNFGYYTNNSLGSYGNTYGSYNPLFDGNDTTINQDIFGDGFLDVSDVYVTFRRSLDPSLIWYRRFWNNGQRVADKGQNVSAHSLVKTAVVKAAVQNNVSITTNSPSPLVNFTAGDVIGSAGKTVSVPITANVIGSYPLRVLMLNLTVTPLDGSPAISTQVTFTQTATVLGTPYLTSSQDAANYAAVWLNSTNAGLTGSVTLGYLNVTIPASAGTNAAYAIHFDHASGSPNGLASFKKNVLTGVLSTSAKTNSTYGDGIPDSWRLRWFGTANNILSVSNACPSGDGVNNWSKYVAGVDPNTANNFPKLNSKAVPSGYSSAIHWPSVSGKKYVISRAPTLFGSNWSILSTNTGTGGDMEFDDNYTNSTKFYRVLILQ